MRVGFVSVVVVVVLTGKPVSIDCGLPDTDCLNLLIVKNCCKRCDLNNYELLIKVAYYYRSWPY